ncbi:MAG: D-cysteine desulfhydrase family protein [Anaerolineales bacterium]|nr:D-cysteine desulfhydrase family protein [Anaerolineales bacterium]
MKNWHSLHTRLSAFPRLPLAEYPTPLECLPRLGQEMGRDIFVKRDDQIGPGLGGNKTRKLEYILAEALRLGHRKVVTFGGLQSNHARITAAAAIKLGLEAHLFYFERRPERLKGNLLVNHLLGAHMHFVPLGGGGDGMTLETTIRLVRWLAWLRLGPHYFIPVGGHSWLGCLGYVNAALEIDAQARALGIDNAWLVVAAGSGGTLAGLLAGLALVESRLRPLGIDVGKLWKGFPDSIASLAGELCARLGEPRAFEPGDIPLIEATYVGQRYGLPSPQGLAAIQRLARLEGLLLDPVYTAKAFAGLLDLVEQGKIEPGAPIIFLHTGGLPALFAFNSQDLIARKTLL